LRRAPIPPAIAVLAGLGLLLFLLPLAGLVVRAPWSQTFAELTNTTTTTALALSIFCSLTATAIALVLGVPLAMILARTRGTLRNVLRALTTLPMVLPPVVGGVALLLAFGRHGVAGSYLYQWFGIQISFTTAAAVMAETFVAMPFLVIAVEAGLRSLDHRYEEAARSLGAGYWRVFTRVTLPLLRPAIFSGAVLCWARALGEFGATITFAGNFPGRTQTVPIAVYLALETNPNPDAAITLSLILLVVSVAILVGMRDRWLGAL
jgi:molybdate transport system permease protein